MIVRNVRRWMLAGTVAGAGLVGFGSPVFADEEAFTPPESRISGTLSFDYNTHFISYGADVWGAGSSWRDNNTGTFNPSVELAWDLGAVSLFTGTWWDMNSHADSGIGGKLQEVDAWVGAALDVDRFTVGLIYQEWYYAGDTERVVDVTLGFDDSDLLFEGFALNPNIVFHNRVNLGAAAGSEGLAVVFGVAPDFLLFELGDYPFTLSVPANVGIFESNFHGGDSGFGFASVGGQLSVPLAFISEEFGAWSFNTGLTYYHTDRGTIPGNPSRNFVTGNIGLSVSF